MKTTVSKYTVFSLDRCWLVVKKCGGERGQRQNWMSETVVCHRNGSHAWFGVRIENLIWSDSVNSGSAYTRLLGWWVGCLLRRRMTDQLSVCVLGCASTATSCMLRLTTTIYRKIYSKYASDDAMPMRGQARLIQSPMLLTPFIHSIT